MLIKVHSTLVFIVTQSPKGCELLRSARLSVCLTAHFKTTRRKLHEISLHLSRGRGSVLLRRQCNMLCTSGFVDDVMFSDSAANTDVDLQS